MEREGYCGFSSSFYPFLNDIPSTLVGGTLTEGLMGISGRYIGAFAILTIFGSAPAFAYLDPATGSIIIQAVIGAVAGGLLYAKLFMHRVRSFLGRKSGEAASENTED